MSLPTAIIDVDGTLVDSNFHHAFCWHRALEAYGVAREVKAVMSLVGMGGDQLIEAAAGAEVERRSGDAIRELHDDLFSDMLAEIRPIPGARLMVAALAADDRRLVLASSSPAREVRHYAAMLEIGGFLDGFVSGDDVEATKPAPDLIEVARARGGGGPAVMIGDSPWDCVAAGRAGVPAVALLTGGFCDATLRSAGASVVYESTAHLAKELGAPIWRPPAVPVT